MLSGSGRPPPASVGWATTRWNTRRQRLGIGERADRRPGDPGAPRAGQRHGSGRHPLDAGAAATPRSWGTASLSSHLLGEVQATVDRLVANRVCWIVADGSLAELLTGGRTVVRGLDNVTLAGASRAAGHQVRTEGGALTVDATSEQVGRIAASAGRLLELRDGGACGGLEDLFFSAHQLGRATAGARALPAPHPPRPNRPPQPKERRIA